MCVCVRFILTFILSKYGVDVTIFNPFRVGSRLPDEIMKYCCVITTKAPLLIVKNTVRHLITVKCGRMQPHINDRIEQSCKGLVN
jgi:hypothetical protein